MPVPLVLEFRDRSWNFWFSTPCNRSINVLWSTNCSLLCSVLQLVVTMCAFGPGTLLEDALYIQQSRHFGSEDLCGLPFGVIEINYLFPPNLCSCLLCCQIRAHILYLIHRFIDICRVGDRLLSMQLSRASVERLLLPTSSKFRCNTPYLGVFPWHYWQPLSSFIRQNWDRTSRTEGPFHIIWGVLQLE